MPNGKKGFTSVFLTMIFGAMILLVFAFIQISSAKAAASAYNSVFSLAGQSILSEFDIHLKEEYGLIAFGMGDQQIRDRLNYYGKATFENNRRLNMIPIRLGSIETDLRNYSLADPQIMEAEILEVMKYRLLQELTGINGQEEEQIPEKFEAEGALHQGKEVDGRVLRSQSIMQALPSRELKKSNIFVQLLLHTEPDSLSEMMKNLGKNLVIDQYIKIYFRNHQRARTEGCEPFFINETEYILYGYPSDEENLKRFEGDFIKFRTAMNLIHIYSDTVKMQEITTLATLLNPGPTTVAAQVLLATAWAGAEAVNDNRLLQKGNKVPLLKSTDTWALTLEEGSKLGDGVILPKSESGYNYPEYLELFLAFENKEVKLLRVMDLIQLNMIGNFDRNFLMNQHHTGLQYEVMVNGKKIKYDKNYQ